MTPGQASFFFDYFMDQYIDYTFFYSLKGTRLLVKEVDFVRKGETGTFLNLGGFFLIVRIGLDFWSRRLFFNIHFTVLKQVELSASS